MQSVRMSSRVVSSGEHLGQRVRRRRLELGLSQTGLGRRVRLSQPRISQIEKGQDGGPLPLRTLCDLADALGVDLAMLVADDPAYDSVDWHDAEALEPPQGSLARTPLPLVGRDDDLVAVTELLQGSCRLLTLVGPGGVGKTQLALHACAALEAAFGGRVAVISLEAHRDGPGILTAIARGIGLRERDARPLRERLRNSLRKNGGLVVLDNVEQAIPAVAELATDILGTCRGVSLLVTGRAPLGVGAEQVYPVRPLPISSADADLLHVLDRPPPSVELFVRRARAVAPGFRLTPANVADVVAICRRVDGLPLAIELVAPRVNVFSTRQIVDQLKSPLASLGGGPRDLPGRQQSLRANIAWSVELLDRRQQAVFRHLAVFTGGFTLEAAASIADRAAGNAPFALERCIASLLDQNLLTRIEHDDGTIRFAMLDTIREYGRAQLLAAGEDTDLHNRHLEWCLALAEAAMSCMFTSAEQEWVDRLQREDGNLQAAIEWAFGSGRASAVESGLRLVGALPDYWYVSGQLSHGRSWLQRAVRLASGLPPSLGKARCLAGASLIAQVQAATETAAEDAANALEMARALGDRSTSGRALLVLGNLALMRGQYEEARSLHHRALRHFEELGDGPSIAVLHINLGLSHHWQGDAAGAAPHADRGLAMTRAIGDRWDAMAALRLQGELARDRGEQDLAAKLLGESLILAAQYASEREIADSLSALGTVAARAGNAVRAARLLGAAESLYRRLDIAIPPPMRPDWYNVVDRLRDDLGRGQLEREWSALSADQAVRDAIETAREIP
jgi:serine/threonine-protein kinase PknK